jgi:hypothetical protein
MINTQYGDAILLLPHMTERVSSKTIYYGWHEDETGSYSIWINNGRLYALKND